MDYVILYVRDLDESVRFYREVLGLPFGDRMETYAEFRLANLKLGLLDRRVVPDLLGGDPGRGGGSEIVFLVEDVDAEAERLRAGGARILSGPSDRPWGHRTLHLSDPDGHVVELAQEIVRSS
ncbi:MAG: VOC family protein [Actinomycetota bacterium]